MSIDTTERDLLAQAIYDRVRPMEWAPTAMTDFAECVAAADAVIEWLSGRGEEAVRKAELEGLKTAKDLILADTNPHGRYGSLNEGSRSEWFSKGLREAARRIDLVLEASE
jgi:hypothetical protein